MPDKDVNYKVNVVKGRESGIDSLQRAKQTADRFEDSLSDATRQARQLDSAVARAGTSSRGLSSINTQKLGGGLERVLGGLGAGELSNLVGLVGDIGDVTEALGGGLKGALTALVSPLGVVSAAAFAAGAAFALLTQELEKTEAAYRDALGNLRTDIDAEVAATLAARRALTEGGRAALEKIRTDAQNELDILESIFADYTTILSDTTLSEDIRNQFADALAETVTNIEKTRKSISVYNAALISQQAIAADARQAVTETAEAIKERLTGAVKGLAGITSDASNTLKTFTDTMTRAREASEAASAAAQKAFTDLQTAAQEQVDKLDAQQSALSRALQDTIADLNDDLISAQTQANADIAEAQAESNAARLASEKEYLKASARAEEEYQRENSRIRRDAQISERQAIQQNDISAVLDIRENRRNQIADNRAAFKLEKQQRAEDFADQRAVEEAALAARIADIQRARDEEVSALQAEMTAARAAHEEEKAEIIRLRDGEIERVRAVALANQARYAAEEAAIDRINGKLNTSTPNGSTTSVGGIIPFNGTSNTPLPNLGGALGSGVNVVIQSLNLGEIATPGGVSSAIMNLTQLFAQAFQQLRVGA